MRASHIGHAAAQITSRGGAAKVIGVTSRGVFLARDQRVLFVSLEPWRGPLTINVDGTIDAAVGDSVRLSPTRLFFPAFEVDLAGAAMWQPNALSSARPIVEQRESLRQLASSLLARKAPEGFGVLLPHLLDLSEKQALSASDAALLARLSQLRESLQHSDFDQALPLMEGLLGLGRGLTPSGDDVIIGLLLRLNRWQFSASLRGGPSRRAAATKQSQEDWWSEFNRRVIDRAFQRTTTLSANLIACAAHGEADERLIKVIDGIVTGTPSRAECVECVLGWGSSSGVDALIGMALTTT